MENPSVRRVYHIPTALMLRKRCRSICLIQPVCNSYCIIEGRFSLISLHLVLHSILRFLRLLTVLSDTCCSILKITEGSVVMNYKIKYAGGHVEVLDEHGDFMFSADNEHEAQQEIYAIDAA